MKREKWIGFVVIGALIILCFLFHYFILDHSRLTSTEDGHSIESAELINDIEELTPYAQKKVKEFLKRAKEAGLDVRIVETYRTQARQDKLYAQGRTTPGKIVTCKKVSTHTSRIAFDICKRGKDPYGDDEFFKKAAEIARELNIEAGYYWNEFQDKPHFEVRNE